MTHHARQPLRQLGVGDAMIGPLEKQFVQEVVDAMEDVVESEGQRADPIIVRLL